MSIRKWFGLFLKSNEYEPLKERMIRLEAEIALLNKRIQEDKDTHEKIIIEELNVDKIVVEKLEYNNNFGALGIKELKGRLNIGANYGVGMPNTLNEELKNSLRSTQESSKEENKEDHGQKKQHGPKVSLHKKDL